MEPGQQARQGAVEAVDVVGGQGSAQDREEQVERGHESVLVLAARLFSRHIMTPTSEIVDVRSGSIKRLTRVFWRRPALVLAIRGSDAERRLSPSSPLPAER